MQVKGLHVIPLGKGWKIIYVKIINTLEEFKYKLKKLLYPIYIFLQKPTKCCLPSFDSFRRDIIQKINNNKLRHNKQNNVHGVNYGDNLHIHLSTRAFI